MAARIHSFYPYDLVLPYTSDDLVLVHVFTDVPFPTGRLVGGLDIGCTFDLSELALFEKRGPLHVPAAPPLRASSEGVDLGRMLTLQSIARLAINRSAIGMDLAKLRAISPGRPRGVHQRGKGTLGGVLSSGKVSFDVERTKCGGHVYRFWSVTLAC